MEKQEHSLRLALQKLKNKKVERMSKSTPTSNPFREAHCEDRQPQRKEQQPPRKGYNSSEPPPKAYQPNRQPLKKGHSSISDPPREAYCTYADLVKSNCKPSITTPRRDLYYKPYRTALVTSPQDPTSTVKS